MATRGDTKEVPLVEAKPTDKLSVDEVAELCGMCHSRVCQLLRAGEMKGTKFRGIFWQVERREAEKFKIQPEGKGRPRVNGHSH